MFYKSVIENVLFSFICWCFNLRVKDKNSLQKSVRVTSEIIGDIQRDVTKFRKQQVLRKPRSVLVNESRVLYPMFGTLSSVIYLLVPSSIPLCLRDVRLSPITPSTSLQVYALAIILILTKASYLYNLTLGKCHFPS